MDEAARVLARLARIDELRNGGTGCNGTGFNGTAFNGTGLNGTGLNGTGLNGTGLNGTGLNGTTVNGTVRASAELLDELRALVPEAEAWARAEGDARARTAATKLREEAEGMS